MRHSFATLLDVVCRALYNHGGSLLLEKFGVKTRSKQLYTSVVLSLVQDVQPVSIGGATAMFHVSSPFEFDLFYNEQYNNESEVILDLLSNVEEDDIFYDVGAHVGLYSLLVADQLSEGRVVAFEPHPSNAETLRSNAELNDAPVECVQYALSDTEEDTGFTLNGGPAEARGRLSLADESGANSTSVHTVPGDQLVERNEIPPPDVIKIDVEGAELDVVRGLKETLSREECRLVYCECHPDLLEDQNQTCADVEFALERAGFDVQRMHQRNEQPFIRAGKGEL